MSAKDESPAPKQLQWADPENVVATVHRLKSEGYSVEQIAIAMQISIDAVNRVLAGATFGYVGGVRM